MVKWSGGVIPMSRVTEEGIKLRRQSKGERDERTGVEKVKQGEELSPVLHLTGATKTVKRKS